MLVRLSIDGNIPPFRKWQNMALLLFVLDVPDFHAGAPWLQPFCTVFLCNHNQQIIFLSASFTWIFLFCDCELGSKLVKCKPAGNCRLIHYCWTNNYKMLIQRDNSFKHMWSHDSERQLFKHTCEAIYSQPLVHPIAKYIILPALLNKQKS